MDTKMILLGMLLIAGLSFAEYPDVCKWASTMTDRAYCGLETYYEGWDYSYGYYTLADYLADEDGQYEDYLMNMEVYHHGTGPEDPSIWHGYYWMGENECMEPGVVPAAFRTYRVEYNAYSLKFMREFNAFLRLYLANNPDERSEVMAYIRNIRDDYTDCLSSEPKDE